MFAGAAPLSYTPARIPQTSSYGFLPFLYCTRTILRRYRSQSNNGPARNKVSRSSPGPENDLGDGEELGDLLGEWNKKRAQKPDRQGHAPKKQRQNQFGKDGFKINESLDAVWKTVKPQRPQSGKPQGQKAGDDSYAPFAEWTEPSNEDVNTTTRKRVHRDASQIPFERPQDKARGDPYADLEGTTITPKEKKAFQALFELNKSSRNPESASASATSSSEDAKNKDFETSKQKDGLKKQTDGSTRLPKPPPEFPEPLLNLRKVVASPDQGTPPRLPKRKPGNTTVGDHRIERDERWARQDVFEVKQLMRKATTDVEVWDILRSRVLDRVLALELDGPRSPPKGRKKRGAGKTANVEGAKTTKVQKGSTTVPENPPASQDSISMMEEDPGEIVDTLPASQNETTEVSLANDDYQAADEVPSAHPQPTPQSMADISLRHHRHAFPQHLKNTFFFLRGSFPGSPLPLNIVPLVKSLGPSTATLGLTTDLYNMHLQYHWSKYRDPLSTDAILREMDKNVYEFNDGTRSIVLEIMREIKSARFGRLGTVAQVLGSMERTSTGLRKLSWWYRVMKTRSEDEALRKAQEREAIEMEEREKEERAQERERSRREALIDAAEQDEQDSEALNEASEGDVGEQSEQDTPPARSSAV